MIFSTLAQPPGNPRPTGRGFVTIDGNGREQIGSLSFFKVNNKTQNIFSQVLFALYFPFLGTQKKLLCPFEKYVLQSKSLKNRQEGLQCGIPAFSQRLIKVGFLLRSFKKNVSQKPLLCSCLSHFSICPSLPNIFSYLKNYLNLNGQTDLASASSIHRPIVCECESQHVPKPPKTNI